MSDRMKKTVWLLAGAAMVLAGYLVVREIAYATRMGEVILSPGAHAQSRAVYLLLLCVAFRLLATVLVPGLLLARLWWIWSARKPAIP